MTRHSILAELLYANAISLKRYSDRSLLFSKARKNLLNELMEMQFLVNNLCIKTLTDEHLSMILNIVQIPNAHFVQALKTADPTIDLSPEYDDLLSEMRQMVLSCMNLITSKPKGYRRNVLLHIQAFHNLPRAFLSVTDRRKITISEAREYASFYLK